MLQDVCYSQCCKKSILKRDEENYSDDLFVELEHLPLFLGLIFFQLVDFLVSCGLFIVSVSELSCAR